jgi:hypothetical protein
MTGWGERATLSERHSASPHVLETVEVERRHFSAWTVAQAKYRSMRRRDAVRMQSSRYRHVIMPEVRGGATVMDDIFSDGEDGDEGNENAKRI